MRVGNARATENARDLSDYLTEWGAENVRVLQTKGHPRLVFSRHGTEWFYILPSTPGDTLRATKNAVSDLRHMLGLVRATKRVGERRTRKKRVAAVPTLPPQVTVLDDWHPALRTHALYQAALRVALDEAWRALWRDCMSGAGRA